MKLTHSFILLITVTFLFLIVSQMALAEECREKTVLADKLIKEWDGRITDRIWGPCNIDGISYSAYRITVIHYKQYQTGTKTITQCYCGKTGKWEFNEGDTWVEKYGNTYIKAEVTKRYTSFEPTRPPSNPSSSLTLVNSDTTGGSNGIDLPRLSIRR